MIAFLVLETLVIGVFCALDLILFYLFFEGQLVPMFLIIGDLGRQEPGLRGLQVLPLHPAGLGPDAGGHPGHGRHRPHHLDPRADGLPLRSRACRLWLWLAFFASFAVKMPMWPVHTWLPDAHVEAPTAGSVILAGILLKMGGYGFLRFSLPMFPLRQRTAFTPLIFTLSVIAIVYTSLVAFRQTDIKKLIAYSSVAHMGFVTMGIFSGNAAGRAGRDLPDAQPRGDLRRALPLRRRGLRPHAHPRDRLLRRAGQPHALVRGGLHAVHHGQRRPAGHLAASSARS